jgi:damage-control phosphatase, subfamily I
MKASNACIPCMIGQAYTSVVKCTSDPVLQREILDEVMRRYIGMELNTTPGEHSQLAFETCRELSGVEDPYLADKHAHNAAALELYPELKEQLNKSSDPLRDASLLALAGNIIDLGIMKSFNLTKDIVQQIDRGFDVADFDGFRQATDNANRILYLADNAGEIVFDRLLIEVLGPERITVMVKAGPIINDAMLADAKQVGLTEIVRVIDTGVNWFGFPWEYVSDAAREEFHHADIVISKGHANFETVSELGPEGDKVWYLLKAKCTSVAEELNAKLGNTVLKSHRELRTFWGR